MKILMTLMGLEIGGAETHVVELVKELARRGYDITVASNGGVYVAELEEAGIRHVKLPLHSKSPAALMASYRGLKALIAEEKFDIVHAHARIPAAICGRLAKKMGFTFVTSTHFSFKVNGLLASVTDWGEHTIAVSYDLKQYLLDNYDMPAERISVTINGIDTERFSAAVSPGNLHEEFSLRPDAFRVVYVSRIDSECALAGFCLLDAAEKLYAELPDLELLLVGGGNVFDKLKARAAEVNKKAGREIAKLTGPRTDVASLIAVGDAFVGVSRAALEAMSEEKPVIMAGAQGYVGIFDESKFPAAEDTNFCFRGLRLPDGDALADDIRALHAMSAEQRAALGRYNRQIILDYYSVRRMTDDYVAAWERVRPYGSFDHGDVIISGYYGVDNVGDDSLLTSMIQGIRAIAPDTRITVLSNNPAHTARVQGVRAINRFYLPAVDAEMKHAKLLISGGGSLLQDGTSKKSLYYYITIMRMAKKHGMKLMLYANGLGPLNGKSSRRMAAEIIEAADYVSLREKASLKLARELGVKRELKVSADPAFLLEPAEAPWVKYIAAREKLGKKCFLVSVRSGNNFGGRDNSSDLPLRIAGDIRAIAEKYGLEPLFVPMHPIRDMAITQSLASSVGCGRLLCDLTAAELCGLMGRCAFVIGTRLHTLIFAASMGVPMIGISYDPKIDAFLDYIGQSRFACDTRTLMPGQLESLADSLLAESDVIRAALPGRADALRALAREDCAKAVELLEREE